MVPEYQQPEIYRLLPRAVEDSLRHLLSRGLGFALLGLVAVSWLSLVTWSVTDPSLTHVTREPPTNLLGSFGAIISDLMLQTLGLASVVLLFAPMFWALDLALQGRLSKSSWKLLAFAGSVLLLAGAFSVVPKFIDWPLHHGYGGIVGDGIAAVLTWAVVLFLPSYSSLLSGLILAIAGVYCACLSIGVNANIMQQVVRNIVASRFGRDVRIRRVQTVAPTTRRRVRFRSQPGTERHRQEPQLPVLPPVQDRETRVLREAPTLPIEAPPTHVNEDSWTLHDLPATEPLPIPDQPLESEPTSDLDPDTEAPHHEDGFDPEDDGVGFEAEMDDEGMRIARRFAPASTAQPNGLISSVLSRAVKRNTARKQAENADNSTASSAAADPIVEVAVETAEEPVVSKSAPIDDVDVLDELHEAIPIAVPREVAKPMAARVVKAPRMPSRTAGGYRRPSLNLLTNTPTARPGPEMTQAVLRGTARLLDDVLQRFGVDGEITEIRPGPVVTVYQLSLNRGINPNRVVNLADDIARAMNTESARVAVAPGNNAISIELPNVHQQQIGMREVLSSDAYRSFGGSLPVGLGLSMDAQPVVADLASLSNVLVAGQPGTGKSTCLKSIVLSLVYRNGPEDCRFVMADPGLLELGCFNGIPHLLCPVLSEQDKALAALEWVVAEMDERAKRMAKLSVRSLELFNNRVRNAKKRGELIARTVHTGFCERTGQPVYEYEQMEFEPMPHIVVVIDQLTAFLGADGSRFESSLARICEKGQGVGIHLVAATNTTTELCPTESVTTGFKSQIAYKLESKLGSRRVLGEEGAEQLLGRGDMVLSGGPGQTVRIHAAFVTQEDVEAVGQALRESELRCAPSLMSRLREAFDEAPADD